MAAGSHRSWPAGIILGVGLIVFGCSSPEPTPARLTEATPAVGVESAVLPAVLPAEAGPAVTVDDYRLGAGDQIRLTVFRHQDLSGEFELDGRGAFAMPLVGDVDGLGLSARQLEDRIETRLREGNYLVDPQVSIEVLNYRPFYIIGEVREPGSYAYVNGMTVVNAIALAGGYTYRADQDDVTITRGGSNGTSLEADPETAVLPGDIVEVPERWL